MSSLFLSGPIAVELQPQLLFDADVHLDHVVSRAAKDPATGAAVVQSRRMMGYVQIKPHDVLIPPNVFADLLDFQQGSLGGPVDCIVDIGKSGQRMRIMRVDVSAASGLSGQPVFAAAARGSLILPPDGSWSTVVQRTDTGDVSPNSRRGQRASDPAERRARLPHRVPQGRREARVGHALRRAAVDRHPKAALRHAALRAGQGEDTERGSLFRRCLPPP